MQDLGELTAASFALFVGQLFRIELPGFDTFLLELASVTALPSETRATPTGRQPFSLQFLGEQSDHYLLQHTYRLEHEKMGSLEIFLVPLGLSGRRMQYEAIFT